MAEPPKGQMCGTCRYYQAEPQRQGGVSYPGHCCRYPPVLHTQIEMCLCPPVRLGFWCGEYAPANPETIDDAAVTLARFVLLGDRTAARALADKLREE